MKNLKAWVPDDEEPDTDKEKPNPGLVSLAWILVAIDLADCLFFGIVIDWKVGLAFFAGSLLLFWFAPSLLEVGKKKPPSDQNKSQ